jgi:hypothetical protein
MMHPDIAKALVEQRHEELAQGRRHQTEIEAPGRPARRLPRWRISWSRAVLSPAGVPGTADGGRPDRIGNGGSSLIIIISAHRSA